MSDVINKPEKLASAIYLVTSFFDAQEPLKWRLRNLSADLISGEIKDKFSTVKEILSLFSVAKTAGMVSEMNYDILVRELSKFEQEVEKPLDLIFPHEIVLDERVSPSAPQRIEYIKDNIVIKKTDGKPVLREFGAVSVKKNTRQSIIISILKRKKEIMIKDISTMINDCSEKTIQRELSAMVQSGVLRKAGEKRWSRYSLA